MTSKLSLNVTELRPRITVIGVGGAGCNAINNMIDASLDGVDFVVANTDAQALAASHAEHKLQLGAKLTEGLGAGSRPEIGEAAAEEALEEIRQVVAGSHMVFVAAGMGGGTGTGAASVIARTAKELGILTVAVVTKPFQFEGSRRMRIAEAGIAELKKHVDTLIVIPNQNLFRIASERTTFAEAFVLADQVLYSGVACIVDLIVKEGLINLDFADVRTVMMGMGSAMMGTGEAEGDERAIRAAEEAISNPLLDDVTLAGAKGLLLSISGGTNLTLYEVDEAATRVRQEVDPDANIIVGATFDPTLGDRVRVSIVASGMARTAHAAPQPVESSAGAGRPQPSAMAAPQPFFPASAPQAPASPEHSSREHDMLADVLRETGSATPSQHPAAAHPQPPPVPASQSWHGPDGVEITEMRPGALAQSSYAPPPPAVFGAPPRAPAAVQEEFQPAPPAGVRRAPRRMPEVDDFPPIGQRAYYAKTQPGGPAAPQAPQQDEPRRRGFFDRIAGFGRRESDSQAQRHDTRIQATSKGPQPGRANEPDTGSQAQHPGGVETSPMRPERADLPVFFNKSRR
jgi:cell division protein FtsZ